MEDRAPRRRGRPPPLPATCGFTLIELCVCLVVFAVLAALASGAWKLTREYAMTAATNELIAHLALARSEAIRRHVRVMMCPSRDQRDCLRPEADHTPWQHGWLVYADADGDSEPDDGEVVRGHTGTDGFAIRTSRYRRRVTYQPLGTAGGSTITFAVCAEHEPGWARYITISNTGRARVSRTTESSMECA